MLIKRGILVVKDIDAFLEKYGNKIAFVNAEYIVDENHIYFAAKKAIKAWKEGRRVARTLPLEILLYSAATRQIRDAMKMGIKEGVNDVFAVFLENIEPEGFEEINTRETEKMSREKFEKIVNFFNITKSELDIAGERLDLLVRERIVLFDIYK